MSPEDYMTEEELERYYQEQADKEEYYASFRHHVDDGTETPFPLGEWRL